MRKIEFNHANSKLVKCARKNCTQVVGSEKSQVASRTIEQPKGNCSHVERGRLQSLQATREWRTEKGGDDGDGTMETDCWNKHRSSSSAAFGGMMVR